MTLRERPGDQVLPKPGQEDVSKALQSFIHMWAATNGVQGEAGLVAEDLEARIELGVQRYGQRLQTHNGRDVLRDLYEELLDAAHYAQQLECENLWARHPRTGRTRLVKFSVVQLVFDVKALLLARDAEIP